MKEIKIGIHIPKTAGTSLRVALQNSQQNIVYLYRLPPGIRRSELIEKLKIIENDETQLPDIIYGHMGYGLHEYFQFPATYFTILRDPIERAISLYRHEKRHENALFHEKAKRLNIAEFFQENLSPIFKNSMTKILSGALWQKINWFLAHEEKDELEIARKNLNQFSYVGFTENIDADQEGLSDYFGFNIQLEHHNCDPEPISREDLDDHTIEIICQNFQDDIALYEFAKEKFLKKSQLEFEEVR
ncbi:MAG: hypothetical protein Kow0042_03850 [Calditrichia bacterium]